MGPFEPDVKQPPARPFAFQHHPSGQLVAGLGELTLANALGGRLAVDLEDARQQGIDVGRVTGELRDHQAGVEEIVMVARRMFGGTGVDHRPVEPAP